MTNPPEVVQPQPSPETWMVSPVDTTEGPKMVMIRIASLSGVHVSFLDQEAAENIGKQIIAIAQTARSSLVVPGPGFNLPPSTNGHDHRQS